MGGSIIASEVPCAMCWVIPETKNQSGNNDHAATYADKACGDAGDEADGQQKKCSADVHAL